MYFSQFTTISASKRKYKSSFTASKTTEAEFDVVTIITVTIVYGQISDQQS